MKTTRSAGLVGRKHASRLVTVVAVQYNWNHQVRVAPSKLGEDRAFVVCTCPQLGIHLR